MAVPACFIILLSLILEKKTHLQLKFNVFFSNITYHKLENVHQNTGEGG